MPVDQAGTWRAVAERWRRSDGIAIFLVLSVAAVAPELAECGWWLQDAAEQTAGPRKPCGFRGLAVP